jgi:hypothetical protein
LLEVTLDFMRNRAANFSSPAISMPTPVLTTFLSSCPLAPVRVETADSGVSVLP